MRADTKSWFRVLADFSVALVVSGVVYWATDRRVDLDVGLYLAILALKTAYDTKGSA